MSFKYISAPKPLSHSADLNLDIKPFIQQDQLTVKEETPMALDDEKDDPEMIQFNAELIPEVLQSEAFQSQTSSSASSQDG